MIVALSNSTWSHIKHTTVSLYTIGPLFQVQAPMHQWSVLTRPTMLRSHYRNLFSLCQRDRGTSNFAKMTPVINRDDVESRMPAVSAGLRRRKQKLSMLSRPSGKTLCHLAQLVLATVGAARSVSRECLFRLFHRKGTQNVSKGLNAFCGVFGRGCPQVGRCSNPSPKLLYSQSESRAQIRTGVVPVSGGFLPGRRWRSSAIRTRTIRRSPRTRPPIPRTAGEPDQEIRMRRGVCLFVRCS